MAKQVKEITTVSSPNDTREAMARLLNLLTPRIQVDCGVSRFITAYGTQMVEENESGSRVGALSGFLWNNRDTPRGAYASEFEVVGRGSYTNSFLKVTRITKQDVYWTREYSNKLMVEFKVLLKQHSTTHSPLRVMTLLVLRDVLKYILSMGSNLISLNTTNGVTLVFKEKLRGDRYIQIYLGGCFEHPLPSVEIYHGR